MTRRTRQTRQSPVEPSIKSTQLLDLPDELLVIIATFAISPDEYDCWSSLIRFYGTTLIGTNRRLRRITEGLQKVKDYKVSFQWFKDVGLGEYVDTFGEFVELSQDGYRVRTGNYEILAELTYDELADFNDHLPVFYTACLNAVTFLAKNLTQKIPLNVNMEWFPRGMEGFVNDLIRDLDVLIKNEPNVKLSLASLTIDSGITFLYSGAFGSDEDRDALPSFYDLYKRLAPLTGPGFELSARVPCLNC